MSTATAEPQVPAAVQKIADARDWQKKCESRVDDVASELKEAKEILKQATKSLDDAIEEARGRRTPDLPFADPVECPPSDAAPSDPPVVNGCVVNEYPPEPLHNGTLAVHGDVIDAEYEVRALPAHESETNEAVEDSAALAGEPIEDQPHLLMQLETVKSLTSLETDVKKVSTLQRVEPVQLDGRPHVVASAEHSPTGAAWNLRPLHTVDDFRAVHPDFPQRKFTVPSEVGKPDGDFYGGTRVVVGKGKSAAEYVIGLKGEARRLTHTGVGSERNGKPVGKRK